MRLEWAAQTGAAPSLARSAPAALDLGRGMEESEQREGGVALDLAVVGAKGAYSVHGVPPVRG